MSGAESVFPFFHLLRFVCLTSSDECCFTLTQFFFHGFTGEVNHDKTREKLVNHEPLGE